MSSWSRLRSSPASNTRNRSQSISSNGKTTSMRMKLASSEARKKYEKRNRELAHLASNLLILLALLYDCRLICGENLTTLKTIGQGRGVRGRFRNWRNNSQVRGELWRSLRYKCYLLGIRCRAVEARGTTHTCPRCLTPVKGHHLSGKQSPTSSGNGSLPNVSLAPEWRVKNQRRRLRKGDRWFR